MVFGLRRLSQRWRRLLLQLGSNICAHQSPHRKSTKEVAVTAAALALLSCQEASVAIFYFYFGFIKIEMNELVCTRYERAKYALRWTRTEFQNQFAGEKTLRPAAQKTRRCSFFFFFKSHLNAGRINRGNTLNPLWRRADEKHSICFIGN